MASFAWQPSGLSGCCDLCSTRRLLHELRCMVEALHEEGLVLRSCLANSGALSAERFAAALHRRRFEKIYNVHRHSMRERNLQEVLQMREMSSSFCAWLVRCDIDSLRSTSKHADKCVKAAIEGDYSRSLLVFGGISDLSILNAVERFDPVAASWEPLPRMLEHRHGLSAVAFAGHVYVCGGTDGQRVYLRSTERFSLCSYAWESMPPMSEPRAGHVALSVGGRIYVCGGFDGHRYLKSTETLECKGGSHYWLCGNDMPSRRGRFAAAAISGHLYVCGGYNQRHPLSSAERMDLWAESWRSIPPMSARRCDVAGIALGGKLYIFGGLGPRLVALSSVERFDPGLDLWEPLPGMSMTRFELSAAVVAGSIYICGGRGDYTNSLSSVERFDPVCCQWTILPDMCYQRRGAAAAAAAAANNA